jgi:hypothetical protein
LNYIKTGAFCQKGAAEGGLPPKRLNRSSRWSFRAAVTFPVSFVIGRLFAKMIHIRAKMFIRLI